MWRTDMNVAWCVEHSHSALSEIQSSEMTISVDRKSATNCARSYSLALSEKDAILDDWPFKPSLKGDYVYHGFMILSLLLDSKKRHSILMVPHDGEHANRFKHAIRQCNARIKLYGQPEILHACKKCVHLYPQGKCIYIYGPFIRD
jgi:hypothetical protein